MLKLSINTVFVGCGNLYIAINKEIFGADLDGNTEIMLLIMM